jgi:hypothetical protein
VTLLSPVSDFIAAYFVVDDKTRKQANDLQEKNGQQDRKLCLLQKKIQSLREANKAQIQETPEPREENSHQAEEVSRLMCENASLTEENNEQKQEIGVLGGASKF